MNPSPPLFYLTGCGFDKIIFIVSHFAVCESKASTTLLLFINKSMKHLKSCLTVHLGPLSNSKLIIHVDELTTDAVLRNISDWGIKLSLQSRGFKIKRN